MTSLLTLAIISCASTSAGANTDCGDYLIADAWYNRLRLCPGSAPGAPCITVAGTGQGTALYEGQGSGAEQFDHPSGVTVTGSGEYLVADMNNNRIQLCPANSSGSPCTTVSGTGGKGSGATQLDRPHSVIIIDSNSSGSNSSGSTTVSGEYYLIADTMNHRVQICLASDPGAPCTTVAGTGGQGSGATQLNGPHDVSITGSGDYVIADTKNHRVQLCAAASPGSPCVTVAGVDGVGAGANQLNNPTGVSVTGAGDIAIADTYNDRVQLCPATNQTETGSNCTTVAGTGEQGSDASQLDKPSSVISTSSGDYLIADSDNHRVQLCSAAAPGSPCTTVAGTDGEGSGATQLYLPPRVSITQACDIIVPTSTTTTATITNTSTFSATLPAFIAGARCRYSGATAALSALLLALTCSFQT